jgi:hypothetical protein
MQVLEKRIKAAARNHPFKVIQSEFSGNRQIDLAKSS